MPRASECDGDAAQEAGLPAVVFGGDAAGEGFGQLDKAVGPAEEGQPQTCAPSR